VHGGGRGNQPDRRDSAHGEVGGAVEENGDAGDPAAIQAATLGIQAGRAGLGTAAAAALLMRSPCLRRDQEIGRLRARKAATRARLAQVVEQ